MRLRWKIAQAAEIRWWQRYLRKKNLEDYLLWKKQYWTDFLTKCGMVVPDHAYCLDAGCGPAGIFTLLNQQRVDAIDPLLLQYEEKLSVFKPKEYPSVQFFSESIETFQPKQQYDYIFCLNAINHVADWEASMARLFDWAKPGATLLLSTDVHRSKLLKPIFKALPGDILHPHQHSLKDYQQCIAAYEPEAVETIFIKREAIFDYYAFRIQCKK